MNNGIHGLGGGRTNNKISGYAGKVTTVQSNVALAIAAAAPIAVNTATVTATVRTRLAAVNGKGAVLLTMAAHGTDVVSSSPVVELVIDGEVIIRNTYTSSTLNTGILLAGYASYNSGDVYPVPIQCSFDYIPFDSNAELWVTTTGSLTSVKYSFLAELYK